MHGAGIANPFDVVRPEVPGMSQDSAAYGLSKPEAKDFKPTGAETPRGQISKLCVPPMIPCKNQ